MENEFVSYTQALALKELGFDEPCFALYNRSDKPVIAGNTPVHNSKTEDDLIICTPLYQQAFRWFREKHNLVFNFISYNIVKPGEYHWSITWNDEAKASGIVKTYEEAEQACLDKLIEICKNKQI
jgi:hypothetical protein